MDIQRIAALNKRLGEICKILTEATNIKNETGTTPLPYDIYKKLCDERRQIREEMSKI
jgi:hypothetical protein